MARFTIYLLGILLSLLSGQFTAPLHAQQAGCTRVGWVVSMDSACGATLIDLDEGKLLQVVGNTAGLELWKTVRFGSAPAIVPAGCIPEGQAVVLTCVSDTLPCEAAYNHVVHDDNPLRLTFQADLYDPLSQNCTWTFGDGASASGAVVEHTFSQEGYFDVCLTVSDGYGCETSICKSIYVDNQSASSCGFDLQVTAINNTLHATLIPGDAQYNQLVEVEWFLHKSNQILGNSRKLVYDLPAAGTYLVCAQYTVQWNDDNTQCTTTRCQQVTVAEASCIAPALVNPTALCPMLFAPVCGCNGITYVNECEAMAAGVTTWWAGPCNTTTGSCHADLKFKILSGGVDTAYTVRFYNEAGGNITELQLDFGDETPIFNGTDWDSLEHVYAEGGIYRANLTSWNNSACVSSVNKLVITDAFNSVNGDLPALTDYVWPGDANGDARANVYDLLNIGVLYLETGSPRPHASPEWKPQFAPNWHTALGVNSKHTDCDGDGAINDFDTDPIEMHYAPVEPDFSPVLPGSPPVYLDFVQDTIFLNSNSSSQFVEIEADVMVGSPTQPAFGLYGMAMALQYPDYVEHDPEADYPFNNLFGHSNHVLWLPKDNYAERQFDLGFVRKTGQAVSGYGRVARMRFRADYIIIIDIAARSSNLLAPFSVDIRGLQAIDAEGNPLNFSVPSPDTVWFVLSTNTTNIPGAERVTVSPNPATTEITVFTAELPVESLELVNSLGQVVWRKETTGGNQQHQIAVGTLPSGIYTVHIHTARGIVTRKVSVK